uniref:Uncharacterized protein n=1 Tax=Octopus bimaculoides TaxID=37653 RepID=A0A0L8HSH1_OCTBM
MSLTNSDDSLEIDQQFVLSCNLLSFYISHHFLQNQFHFLNYEISVRNNSLEHLSEIVQLAHWLTEIHFYLSLSISDLNYHVHRSCDQFWSHDQVLFDIYKNLLHSDKWGNNVHCYKSSGHFQPNWNEIFDYRVYSFDIS